MKQTSKEKAEQMLYLEAFYWGQKGLETTQRCAHKASMIRAEMSAIGADELILDYWSEVFNEIYKQGQ